MLDPPGPFALPAVGENSPVAVIRVPLEARDTDPLSGCVQFGDEPIKRVDNFAEVVEVPTVPPGVRIVVAWPV
jgi:hypothetical protein